MSDEAGVAPAASPTAGSLLRQARERQGLHVAALAAAIKVVPRKLELLEADRIDELPDATFARALAQTVCRALKIDSAPILRLLPVPPGHPLERVGEGLNAPFRERPGALVQRDGPSFATSPAFWVTGLIVVTALAIYFIPSGFFGGAASRARAASSAEGASAAPVEVAPLAASPALIGAQPQSAASAAASAVVSIAAVDARASGVPGNLTPGEAPELAAVPPAGVIQLQTSAASWIVVTDARERTLVSRLLQPGEALGLDGVAPFKVRIGNAAGTRIAFRGQPLELADYTRDNVARLELK